MKGSSHFKCKPHCLAFPDNCSKCIHCGRRPAVRTRNSPKASTRSQSASGKARESFRHFRHLLKYIFSQYHAGWQDQPLHFLIWLHTQRVLLDSTASHMHSALVALCIWAGTLQSTSARESGTFTDAGCPQTARELVSGWVSREKEVIFYSTVTK